MMHSIRHRELVLFRFKGSLLNPSALLMYCMFWGWPRTSYLFPSWTTRDFKWSFETIECISGPRGQIGVWIGWLGSEAGRCIDYTLSMQQLWSATAAFRVSCGIGGWHTYTMEHWGTWDRLSLEFLRYRRRSITTARVVLWGRTSGSLSHRVSTSLRSPWT